MIRWSILGIFLAYALTSSAQLNPVHYQIPGSVYTQGFNQLPISGTSTLTGKGPHALDQPPLLLHTLTGWQVMQIAGSQPNTNFLSGTGSGTGSGIYSFGQSGNTNRSLGSLASGTGIYAWGVVFENRTGTILNKVNISFLATQWRKGGSTNKNTWRFGYQTGIQLTIDTNTVIRRTELDLISVHSTSGTATLNGHLPVNQYLVTATLSDITWRPGERLMLRWDDQDETGSDDGMGIDDFHFTATSEPNKPFISTLVVDSVSSKYALIKTSVNDKLAATSIFLEYDTVRNLTNPIQVVNLSPTNLPPGSGNTLIEASLNNLLPGKNYYLRVVATNSMGQTSSDTIHFKTKTGPPDISTDSIITDKFNELIIYGKLLSDNGSPVLENGFCWAVNDTPTVNKNKITVPVSDSIFTGVLKEVPLNTNLLIRAFSVNSEGLTYGNILQVRTPVTVISFSSDHTYTNQDTILYQLKLQQPVSHILADDITIRSLPKNDAQVLSVNRENESTYMVKIYSGNTDAAITPVLLHRKQHYPSLASLMYEGNTIIVDKTPPLIRQVTLPNRPYKTGDSILITITIQPDSSSLILMDGNLSGYPIINLIKQNDSTLQTVCIVKAGGAEIAAQENLMASVLLQDKAGNRNTVSSFPIQQSQDAIDHTRPFIKEILIPARKKYKAGDTLHFSLVWNEAIICDTSLGKPVLSVTIGTRIRNPLLAQQSEKNILLFSYQIQPDESDLDGIRIANTITLNNAVIRDIAGNNLINSIPNAGIINDLLVDAVQPEITAVTTPTPKIYGIGDTLLFIVHWSKPVQINTDIVPYLEVVIGNEKYKVLYLSGAPGNKLSFYLVIQKGMLDKNGIVLSGMLFNDLSVKDETGNTVIPVLKSIGALSSVDIDGIAPQWKNAALITADVCSKGTISFTSLLQILDEEKTGGHKWTLIEAPQKGFITGLPFTTKQGLEIAEPIITNYTNTDKTSEKDECTIEVSDGVNNIRKKIQFLIHAPIENNQVEHDQIICLGTTPQLLKGAVTNGGNGVYQFIWQSADILKPDLFQSVHPTQSYQSFQPDKLTQSTLFRRVVLSGGCADTSNTILIEVKNKGLWLGKLNNSWHTGGNWCGAMVPNEQTDVFIQTNDQAVQITDSAFCNSLYLLNNSKLAINGILSYMGGIIGQGAIQASRGTVISNGKQPQWLPAQAFENNSIATLITNGTELIISDSLMITTSLEILKGKLFTNDLLILRDDAKILPNAAGIQLRGRITKEHTLKNNWITNPFRETIPFSQQSILTQKNLDTASFVGVTNSSPYVHQFMVIDSWSTKTSRRQLTWKKTATDTIAGISFWKYGNGLSSVEPFKEKNTVQLLMKGYPVIGDEEISFPNTVDTAYHLTGNPYVSDILSTRISVGEGIGNYFWIWDSSLSVTGGYAAKAFTSNHVLHPLQGFIIKSIPGKDHFIRFSEQAKIVHPLPDSIQDIIENTYQTELSLWNNQTLLDRLLILDTDTARTQYEAADAEKILNADYNLYSLSRDEISLAIDARPLNQRTYIPLGVQVKQQGAYSIKFSRVWLPKEIKLELHDLFTGTITKLVSDSSYQFQVTSDTSSQGDKRFIIRSPIPPEPQEEPIQIKLSPVPAQNQLAVYFKSYKPGNSFILIKTMNGQVLRKQNLGQQQEGSFYISLNGLLNGQHIIEIHCGQKFIASCFIKL